MKPVSIFAVLTLFIFFMISLNKNILSDNSVNDTNKKLKNKILKLKNRSNLKNHYYYNDQNHASENDEFHLSTKQAIKPSDFNISKQLNDSKYRCWDKPIPVHRILNGKDVGSYALKWMAAIFTTYKEMYKDTEFACGGAIISTKFVLTAAHCIVTSNEYGFSVIKHEDIFVRYGMLDLSSRTYVEQQVERTFPHPGYFNLKGCYNDIALIKLKYPILYTNVINPICIPYINTPDDWNNLIKEKHVLISGWGNTAPELKPTPRSSITLQKGYALLEDHCECKEWEGLYNQTTTFCLGLKLNISKVCKGDSGGPIVPLIYLQKGDNTILPVVIGINSFGNKTCLGPQVLTKVESFNTWINTMTM